jgi:hypothetical protein
MSCASLSLFRLEALLKSLMQLTKLTAVDVQTSGALANIFIIHNRQLTLCPSFPVDDSVEIKVEISGISATLRLRSDMKLVDIEVADDSVLSKSLLSKILRDATKLTPPQDIRYAIFALSAAQDARVALSRDISDLRKRCLVSMQDAKEDALCALQLTMSNGLVANLVIHECYPQIPACVKLDSLVGIGGWNANDLQQLQREINEKAYCRIHQVFDAILSTVSN